MSHFQKFSLVVLTLIGLSTRMYAQNSYFEWINNKSGLRERIDVATHHHSLEIEPGVWKLAENSFVEDETFRDLPLDFGHHFFYFNQDRLVKFTFPGTGQVYQYDIVKNTLSRLDNTHYKGYNFKATQFLRRDTIYNFGGYGFWHYTNVITFYDQEFREWQLIRPYDEGPKSLAGGYQGYDAKNDIFYSGAAESDLATRKFGKTIDENVYAFDFKNQNWSKLGAINPKLPFRTLRSIYWDGEHFFQWSGDKIYLIDPQANKVFLVNDPIRCCFHPDDRFYSIGDTIYNYWANQKNLTKLSKSNILKKAKFIGAFYTSPASNQFLYILLLFVVIILGFGVFLGLRKRKYKNHNKSFLNPIELTLLNKMIALSQFGDKQLSVIEVNEILNIDQKSPDNQRIIRMKFLNDLNAKLLMNLQIDEAIERVSSAEDKRLVLYKLKPEAVEKLNRKIG